jgi:hypothetical protein
MGVGRGKRKPWIPLERPRRKSLEILDGRQVVQTQAKGAIRRVRLALG